MTPRIPPLARLAAVILLGAAPAFPGAAPALAEPGVPLRDSVPHITATGQASAEVVPDQADLRLGVSSEQPSAEAAAAATATQAGAVVETLKAEGVAAGDIVTNFSLSAEYDSTTDPQTHGNRRTLRGYAAETQITARLRDVAKAGAIARLLIDRGANGVRGIDYSYAGERALRRRLRGEAARDAVAEARAATDALGLTLGRVLEIGEEAPAGRAVSRLAAPASLAAGGVPRTAIPTEPGRQLIMESATVTFEIAGRAP